MFESLDGVALSELSKLDDRASLNPKTELAKLVACLESAEAECQQKYLMEGPSGAGFHHATGGMRAAKRIVTAYWNKTANGKDGA